MESALTTPAPSVIYTRPESGSRPVSVILGADGGRSYVLDGTLTYPSARQLLIAVTGHRSARHWTFDRYFRLGRWSASPPFPSVIEELVGPGGWAVPLVTSGGPIAAREVRRKRGSKVYPVQTEIGIDLVKRGGEVAKLLFAGFSGMIRAGGFDPDDVLQELYKGILVRNAGSCPFDPAKASFGHYVHMVARCVLANYHRKQQRHNQEQLGLPGGDDGDLDAGDDRALHGVVPVYDSTDSLALRDVVSTLKVHPQRALAVQVLPLLREGWSRDEIAERLGESKTNVGRALTLIRDHLRSGR